MLASHLLNAACHLPAALPALRADTSRDKATDTCADAQSGSLVRKVPLLESPIMVTVSLQALYLVLLLFLLFIYLESSLHAEASSPNPQVLDVTTLPTRLHSHPRHSQLNCSQLNVK